MVDTVKLMNDFLAKSNSLDSGAIGKAFEYAIHKYITPRTNAIVTRNGSSYGDLFKLIDRKRVCFEVKTACGELGVLSTENYILDDLFKGMDYIIYCPEVDTSFPAESQGYVFPRDEFLSFLAGYDGRGQFLRIKQATNGGYRVSIQSFRSANRPKASQPISEYIYSTCYEYPTVDEFFTAE